MTGQKKGHPGVMKENQVLKERGGGLGKTWKVINESEDNTEGRDIRKSGRRGDVPSLSASQKKKNPLKGIREERQRRDQYGTRRRR